MSIAPPKSVEEYLAGPSVLVPKANPVHSEKIKFEEVEELRWLGCPHYGKCLQHAALSGWTSFVCTQCELAVRDTNTLEGTDAKQTR